MLSQQELFDVFINKLILEIPTTLAFDTSNGVRPTQYHFKDFMGFFLRDDLLGLYAYDKNNKSYHYLYPIADLDTELKAELSILFRKK